MPIVKPMPATDSSAELRPLVGDDATASFEADPKFADSNPTASASSENLAVQRDTDDTEESEEEIADEEDEQEEYDEDEDEDEEVDEEDDEDDLDEDQKDDEGDEDEDIEDDEDEVGAAAA